MTLIDVDAFDVDFEAQMAVVLQINFQHISASSRSS